MANIIYPTTTGTAVKLVRPLAFNKYTNNSGYTVCGAALFDPTNNFVNFTDVTTLVNTVKLEVLGFVESLSDTLEVQLYNFSDASAIHTGTITSTTTDFFLSGPLTFPSSQKMYELRIRNSEGTGAVTLLSANLIIDYSFI
jgi:hypothetical protein